jgi:cell wall-associated NlpC family hydrolase
LHHPRNASPYEHHCSTWNELFRIGSLFLASCFLIFYCLASEASAARRPAAKPAPPSCTVTKSQSAKVSAQPKSQPAAKAKTSVRTSKKPKAAPKPLVSEVTKTKAEAITNGISTELPESLENEITKFFGLRYRFGGEGQSGFDCSGLIKQVYSEVFGINLPRSSREQSQLGSLEPVDRDELKTGDLVFFGPGRKNVNHVGMYLAGGHFLHAARSEGVTISRLDDGYWKSRYMFSKRARGLELNFDEDEDADLTKALVRDSFSSAFKTGSAVDNFSFLEAGIEINDSLEFLVSGFFLNALEANGTPPDSQASAAIPLSDPSDADGGFRLSAVLSPLEWIKLIPSITQVDDDKKEKNQDRNQQKLGLETWMILPSSRVSVFMAAHARNQEDFFERPLGVSPDWQTMDFAIGLHYHLSDSLRFSLWGTQAANPDLKTSEDAGRRNSPVEDVSFQFDIRF